MVNFPTQVTKHAVACLRNEGSARILTVSERVKSGHRRRLVPDGFNGRAFKTPPFSCRASLSVHVVRLSRRIFRHHFMPGCIPNSAVILLCLSTGLFISVAARLNLALRNSYESLTNFHRIEALVFVPTVG